MSMAEVRHVSLELSFFGAAPVARRCWAGPRSRGARHLELRARRVEHTRTRVTRDTFLARRERRLCLARSGASTRCCRPRVNRSLTECRRCRRRARPRRRAMVASACHIAAAGAGSCAPVVVCSRHPFLPLFLFLPLSFPVFTTAAQNPPRPLSTAVLRRRSHRLHVSAPPTLFSRSPRSGSACTRVSFFLHVDLPCDHGSGIQRADPAASRGARPPTRKGSTRGGRPTPAAWRSPT